MADGILQNEFNRQTNVSFYDIIYNMDTIE